MKKKLKKSLSQNFLVNKFVIKKILESINIKKDDVILEIGAGDGAISNFLSKLSNNIFLIELDKNLINNLNSNSNLKDVKIYNDDILKFDFNIFFEKFSKIRLIGNIPYKISSKILLKLVDIRSNLSDVYFVVQKELADRFIKNDCNVLVLMVSYYFKIEKLFDIDSSSFYPIPKVDSAFIRFIPYKNKKNILNYFNFRFIVKSFLNKRRKIILKFDYLNFYKRYINLKKRSSDINLCEYIRISNFYTVNKQD